MEAATAHSSAPVLLSFAVEEMESIHVLRVVTITYDFYSCP